VYEETKSTRRLWRDAFCKEEKRKGSLFSCVSIRAMCPFLWDCLTANLLRGWEGLKGLEFRMEEGTMQRSGGWLMSYTKDHGPRSELSRR